MPSTARDVLTNLYQLLLARSLKCGKEGGRDLEMPGNYLLGGWWGTTLWSTVIFLQRYQGEEEEKHRRQSHKDHQLVEIGGGRGY